MMDAFRAVQPEAFAARFLAGGVRPDGRALHSARRVALSRACLSTVDGSAVTRLGTTTVFAGVTLTLVVPGLGEAARADGAGADVDVDVDVGAAAAPRFRGRRAGACDGKRGAAAAALLRELLAGHFVLPRGALDVVDGGDVPGPSGAPRAARWRLALSLVCTGFDGNVEEACVLAATAALSCTIVPAAVESAAGAWRRGVPGEAAAGAADIGGVRAAPARRLRLAALPVASSFVAVPPSGPPSDDGGADDDAFDAGLSGRAASAGAAESAPTSSAVAAVAAVLADPTAAEEELATASLVVVVCGVSGGVLLMRTDGDGAAFDAAATAACVAGAGRRASAVRPMIGGDDA